LPYEDYRLNAQVRAVLVRRWLDLSKVEYGVTNGVVYLRGSLQPYIVDRVEKDERHLREEEAVVAGKLERVLRQLPGVRDVIFKLDGVVKVGWRWRPR
jgi:hypothetical protein